ncbi:MAG: prephenate dehydrogenase [Candidatus Omnitrophota bacterium]|nr:prephenate dehydrogenase [Candidatus Omnitrophota bacterium]
MKPKCIAIVGLGLMGGSLAGACRRKFPHSRILGISRSRAAIAVAKRRRWIHQGFTDLARGVQEADLIVVCTPVDTFSSVLSRIDRTVRAGTIVTDVGSAKGQMMRLIRRKAWKSIEFIGAHPLVGSHKRGMPAADRDLYNEGLIFLIREPKHKAAYRQVKSFWRRISSRVVEISADEHDAVVSAVSHLPHAVAACLMLSIPRSSLRFAGAGLRDSTRIAAASDSVWLPIMLSNRKAILKSMAAFSQEFQALQRGLARRDGRFLLKFLRAAARKRTQI